ncbi:SpnB-like Rossmann fold domain-containing protein, partial [Streptomyces oceani]
VEIGPDGTLTAMARGCVDEEGLAFVPLLRKDRPEGDALVGALGRLHVHGKSPDWSALLPEAPTSPDTDRIDLPTYPFQRERYWLDAPFVSRASDGPDSALYAVDWTEVPLPSEDTESARAEVAVLGRTHPDLAALSASVAQGAPAPGVVVLPWPQDSDGQPTQPATHEPATVHAALAEVLAVVQQWLAEERLSGSTLVVLTSGAVAVPSDEVLCPVAASAWGLLRSAQSENPGRFVLIDTDRPRDLTEAGAEAATETASPVLRAVRAGEPQLALRAGTAHAPRLVRHTPGAPRED